MRIRIWIRNTAFDTPKGKVHPACLRHKTKNIYTQNDYRRSKFPGLRLLSEGSPANGGRDPEKKDRQEQHRPLVSIKNIDEATLSLWAVEKNWRSCDLFSVKPFFKSDEVIVSLLNSQKIGDLAIFFCKTIL